MEHFGRIIQSYIHDLGIEKPILQHQAIIIWPQIVGDNISQVTEPLRLKDGKLFVRVNNDSWRNELVYYKSDIIGKLNRYLGQSIVEEIILL